MLLTRILFTAAPILLMTSNIMGSLLGILPLIWTFQFLLSDRFRLVNSSMEKIIRKYFELSWLGRPTETILHFITSVML